MRTVVLGELPPALDEFLAKCRMLGQDTFDEVWDGEYHVAPGPPAEHSRVDFELSVLLWPRARTAGLVGTGPFNLGVRSNYRVPAGGFHRGSPTGVYLPTAAVVIEVVSPDDETYAKFDFYADCGVDELVVADPQSRTVRIWRLVEGEYTEAGVRGLLGITSADITGAVNWP